VTAKAETKECYTSSAFPLQPVCDYVPFADDPFVGRHAELTGRIIAPPQLLFEG
jgi:hypothetical protein